MNIMVIDSLIDSDSLEGVNFLNNPRLWPLICLDLNMCVRSCVGEVNFIQYIWCVFLWSLLCFKCVAAVKEYV